GGRGGVAGGDEQPVQAAPPDCAAAARLHRQDGRAYCERLDDRVRKVLPARREDRRVGRAEELYDTLPRLRSDELDAVGDAELARAPLERRTIRAFACDDETHTVGARNGLERAIERLLRGQPACERERVSVSSHIWKLAERRHRVRQHADALARDAPRQSERTQIGARREHVGRTAQLDVAREPEQPARRAAAPPLALLPVA